MDDKIKLSFDKEYKIRALEPTKYQKGKELESECSTFVGKVSTFGEKVNALVEILEAHANRIDSQKLRAIGLRMEAENEAENRSRQKRALQAMINEKRAELDRVTTQLMSLEKVESEQRSMLEKITNSQT